MNFELEPWELPPGADIENVSVPIEFGPIEWRGEPTMVSARWLPTTKKSSLVYFRLHSKNFNFTVLQNDGFGAFKARLHGKKLERIVRKALEPKKFYLQSGRFYFGRVFHLQGQLCLLRAGESFLASHCSWLSHTPLEFPFDISSEPSKRIANWLCQQWQTEKSAVRLAWEWNRMDSPQRERWWGDVTPRWNELHQLMRAVATVATLAPDQRWAFE